MKCAIYVRVSKDCEEQKASLQNQQDLFKKYIIERNWEIYDFYIDVQSGSKLKQRRNLQRLINDANNKKFDIILAKELSRLARNGKQTYEIRDIAEKNGIDIITLDGAIDTLSGDIGKFGLYTWLYENEARTISQRIKQALNTKAKRGEYKGSLPPYGYNVVNGKLIVRDDFSPFIVKRIFKEYLNGRGYDAIAKSLYEENIPTPSQLANKSNSTPIWHGSSVRKILTNQNYTGDLVQSKTETISVTSTLRKFNKSSDYITIENCHEAIISKKDFNAVQNLLQSRKKIKPKPQAHLFTNLLFCADCGKGMHFKKNRRGYVCGLYDKLGNKACSDHIVRENELIESILNEIKLFSSLLNNKDTINKIKNALNEDNKSKNIQINKLKTELKKLEEYKLKNLKLLMDDSISKEDYDLFNKSNNIKIYEINSKINSLSKSISKKGSNLTLDRLKEIETLVTDITELTPELLNRLIEKIEIKKDGSARIYYRFSIPSNFYSLINFKQHSACGVFIIPTLF